MKRRDLLDLNDALQHPGKQIAIDLSTDFEDESDIELSEPVEGFLEAVSTGNLLLIHGEFKAKCIMDCARCGTPIEAPLEFTMEEEFPVVGIPSMYSSQDYARVVDDEAIPLFAENSLMVEALLRQGVLVNLPQQTLCSFGWDGDCPNAKNVPNSLLEDVPEGLKKLADLRTSEPQT